MSKSQSTHNNLLMCQIPVNLENNRFWGKISPKKFEQKKKLKT